MTAEPIPPAGRDARMQRICDAATTMITRTGIGGFNMRDLAEELGIAPTLPLYYFGTMAGLLAAVAQNGFAQLGARLAETRRSGAPSIRRLERLALAHGRYGLDKPLLYQAIHSASLWTHASRSSSESAATGKANRWVGRAVAARDAAFAEYVEAVAETQAAGAIARPAPHRITHMLSALVDGFLFQVREEQVLASASVEQKLAYLRSLVRLVIEGLHSRQVPRRGVT